MPKIFIDLSAELKLDRSELKHYDTAAHRYNTYYVFLFVYFFDANVYKDA